MALTLNNHDNWVRCMPLPHGATKHLTATYTCLMQVKLCHTYHCELLFWWFMVFLCVPAVFVCRMHAYVCVCVCMCICVCVCVCMFVCIHVCVSVHTCMCVHDQACVAFACKNTVSQKYKYCQSVHLSCPMVSLPGFLPVSVDISMTTLSSSVAA